MESLAARLIVALVALGKGHRRGARNSKKSCAKLLRRKSSRTQLTSKSFDVSRAQKNAREFCPLSGGFALVIL
jgi:hypothetical protein